MAGIKKDYKIIGRNINFYVILPNTGDMAHELFN